MDGGLKRLYCVLLLIFIQFSFLFLLFVFDLFLTWGVIMVRVAYFIQGGCQVLKLSGGLVSFCFMYFVLCTKSENK